MTDSHPVWASPVVVIGLLRPIRRPAATMTRTAEMSSPVRTGGRVTLLGPWMSRFLPAI